jgi:hypothetical protein
MWVVYLVGSRFAPGLIGRRSRSRFLHRAPAHYHGARAVRSSATRTGDGECVSGMGSELAGELRRRRDGLSPVVDAYPALATTTKDLSPRRVLLDISFCSQTRVRLLPLHQSPHVPFRARQRRRENGVGHARDAGASLALRPYQSLALGPDLKGRALFPRGRRSDFRFP